MTGPLTIERTICLQPRGRGGRKRLAKDHEPGNTSTALGRVPRLARLMALAIRFEDLISAGAVAKADGVATMRSLCAVGAWESRRWMGQPCGPRRTAPGRSASARFS